MLEVFTFFPLVAQLTFLGPDTSRRYTDHTNTHIHTTTMSISGFLSDGVNNVSARKELNKTNRREPASAVPFLDMRGLCLVCV